MEVNGRSKDSVKSHCAVSSVEHECLPHSGIRSWGAGGHKGVRRTGRRKSLRKVLKAVRKTCIDENGSKRSSSSKRLKCTGDPGEPGWGKAMQKSCTPKNRGSRQPGFLQGYIQVKVPNQKKLLKISSQNILVCYHGGTHENVRGGGNKQLRGRRALW